MRHATAFVAALGLGFLTAAWAQIPSPRGEGDRFDTNTGTRSQSGDPLSCFDRSLRAARSAQHAYQMVYGSEWAAQRQCEGRSEGVEALGSCWGALTQARSLLEESAPLFEAGRRTPGRQQTEVIARANALVKQAAGLLDAADRCFRPILAQAQAPRRTRSPPQRPEQGGPLPWEQAAQASPSSDPQRRPVARSGPTPAQQAAQASPSSDPKRRPVARSGPTAAQKQAADDLKRHWQPLKTGAAYSSTQFNGETLHAIKTNRPIHVAHVPQQAKTVQQFFKDHVREGYTASGATSGTFSGYQDYPERVGGPVVQRGKLTAWTKNEAGGKIAPRDFLFYRAPGSAYGPPGFFIVEVPAYRKMKADNKTVDDAASVRERQNNLPNFIARLGAAEGLGGLGTVLKNGVDVHEKNKGRQGLDDAQAGEGKNARTLAGVSNRNQTLILLVQEGKSIAKSKVFEGAGIGELAGVLQALGVTDAALMDGGGTAEIFIPEIKVNSLASPKQGHAPRLGSSGIHF